METGRIADEYGYETVWILDHLLTAPPSQEYIFECWTTVAALLRETERVRVGQMVSGNGYRNPACWRGWPPPSTCSGAVGSRSASARVGTSRGADRDPR